MVIRESLSWPVVVAALLCALAVIVLCLPWVVPSRTIPVSRRRYGSSHNGILAQSTTTTTSWIQRLIENVGKAQTWSTALDRAGIRRDVPEFVLLVGAAALTALALGTVVINLFIGILLAVVVVGGAAAWVSLKADGRKRKFADQLDDLSQLLATNLRAGHSLLQSLSALVTDIEEPARSELTRVVNQVRVGRDLGDALDETANRMGSDDFSWIAQAIAIHRQVGGNLSDVLDTVGETIRDRNGIRRQVRALSAEGRMSAWILMGLPVLVAAALSVMNPVYLSTFIQTPLGWIMLGACCISLTLGGLWIRNIVKVEF